MISVRIQNLNMPISLYLNYAYKNYAIQGPHFLVVLNELRALNLMVIVYFVTGRDVDNTLNLVVLLSLSNTQPYRRYARIFYGILLDLVRKK